MGSKKMWVCPARFGLRRAKATCLEGSSRTCSGQGAALDQQAKQAADPGLSNLVATVGTHR